jgi:hypothetical protein
LSSQIRLRVPSRCLAYLIGYRSASHRRSPCRWSFCNCQMSSRKQKFVPRNADIAQERPFSAGEGSRSWCESVAIEMYRYTAIAAVPVSLRNPTPPSPKSPRCHIPASHLTTSRYRLIFSKTRRSRVASRYPPDLSDNFESETTGEVGATHLLGATPRARAVWRDIKLARNNLPPTTDPCSPW